MAEQGPRSIANMVFVVILAALVAGVGLMTFEMLQAVTAKA
jgi:hypothetical protein